MFHDDAFGYDDHKYRNNSVQPQTPALAKSVSEPYSPADAAAAKTSAIPDEVFVTINHLLAIHLQNGRAIIKQKDIIEGVRSRTSSDFQHVWLNFEEVYRKRGWNISLDAPGYNESYDAMYTFSDASKWKS